MSTVHDPVRRSQDSLWQAVAVGDEAAVAGAALTAVDHGLGVESVLLDVIGGVQRHIGEEWAANRLSVAREHAMTALNDRVITTLASAVPRPQPHLARVVVACVDGEWHTLPARLLAEVLVLRGFHVDYLGGQLPIPYLIHHLRATGAQVVALSSSLASRLPTAHAMITACQEAGTAVLVGGSAFGPRGQHARLLGADLWAPDARTAGDLLAEDLPARPRQARRPVGDLSHLADQEYTLVSRSGARLVRTLSARLDSARREDDPARIPSSHHLAHLVDFLCAALYTDDPVLLTDHLTWVDGILAARGAPARFLHDALETLAVELRDFPRAVRLLRDSQSAVAAGRDTPSA